MKRSAALASLSRDHHPALFVAQKLRRASEQTPARRTKRSSHTGPRTADGTSASRRRRCCPATPPTADVHHPIVLAVLGDHVAIRQRADRLTTGSSASPQALHDLGERLAAHVRLEEHELSRLIEQTMPATRTCAA